MNKLFYLVFVLLGCSNAFAQYNIKGNVRNSVNEVLSGATVIIKNSSDIMVGYCVTDNMGKYEWKTNENIVYNITFSYLGYMPETIQIDFNNKISITKNITLLPTNTKLEEVVIEYNRPVSRSNDTLTYYAKALETGNEYSVEELLKNIPGITITDVGDISYNGKPVEKVLVEGDDLLSAAYATLTKNMPIKPLDKIQILEHFSRNKLLKGIENSDAVAINLTLDEKYKSIWFGNAEVGLGYKERYSGNFNLMNFGKKYKTFFNYSLNNLGVDGIREIAEKQFSESDLETIGITEGSDKLMHGFLGGLPIEKKRYNFNKNQKGTLSTIVPLGKTTKLRIRAFVGGESVSSYRNSNTSYSFEDTFFENSEFNYSNNKMQKQYVSGMLTAEPSKNSLLQSLTTINRGTERYKSNINFNGAESNEKLSTESLFFDEQLTYTYKWNSKSVVLLKGRFLYDESPQKYHNDTYLLGDLFDYENLTDIYNNTKSKLQYAGFQSDVKLKQASGDLFDFQVGVDYSYKIIDALFQLQSNNELIAPDDYQFNGSTALVDIYAQSAYNWDLDKFSIQLGGDLHQLFNSYKSLDQLETNNRFIINPNLSLHWELTNQSYLSTSYNYKNRTTDILQMTNGYLFSPSRSFRRGIGAFNVFGAHNVQLNYKTTHYLNRHGLMVGLMYQKNKKALSSRSVLDQNSYVSEAVLIDGGENLNANTEIFKVLKVLQGTITLKGSMNRGTYYNFLNGSDLRKNTSYNFVYGLLWGSSFDGDFNFKLETEWNSSRIETQSDTFTSTDSKATLKLMYNSQQKLNIEADLQQYYFGNLQNKKNYFFLDLNSRYNIKNDKYAVSLSIVNLLNAQSFTRYQINDYSNATDSYNLIPRYVITTFEFKF